MKKIVKHGLTILSLAVLTTATASAATPGGYLGAGLGYSKLHTPDENLIKSDSAKVFKQSHQLGGLGGRIFGGFNFNEYLGLEAGIAQYAKSKYDTNLQKNAFANFTGNREFTMTTGDLVAKAYLPLGQSGFNVYALGGAALVHSKGKESVKVNSPFISGSVSESKTQNRIRPKFGIGASYDIPETKFTTNLEWSRIQGTGNTKNSLKAIPNADMVTLNISYKFD